MSLRPSIAASPVVSCEGIAGRRLEAAVERRRRTRRARRGGPLAVLLCALALLLVADPVGGLGGAWSGLRVAAAAEGPGPAPCSLGLSRSGGTGLFDLQLAEAGCPWRLRFGIGLSGFSQGGYLLSDDTFTQLAGTVQVAASIGSHLETALQIGSRSSRAVRPLMDAKPADISLLALGEISLTVKLHTQWGRLVHAAVQSLLRVHSGPDDLGPNFRSADFGVDILGSVELQRAVSKLPLRLHWLLGYLYDRSSELLGAQDCMAAGSAQCLATRLISTAAYDVGQPRLRIALGADALFAVHRKVSLGPLLAYHAEVVTGDGDPVLRELLRVQGLTDGIDERLAQWLTVGARLHLTLPMTLELGMQIGLESAGYASGPKLTQLVGYGALSWELELLGAEAASGPGGHRAADSESGSAESARLAGGHGPGQGSIAGVVRDARTGITLPDALVRLVGVHHNALLADERGEFRSAPLPAGAVVIEASRSDHLTARQIVWVRPAEVVPVELKLPPVERPALGRLWLELNAEAGGPPRATATLVREGQSVELTPQPGGLVARVPAGPWTLRIDANGYLSREQTVVLPSGGEQRLRFTLLRRPAAPRVQLGAGEILLREPLEFVPASAALSPDAARLLDEVIDLLVHHPELRLLRIEHQGAPADGAGGPSPATLGEQQAIAVRDYLVQHGVAPERVVARAVVASPGPGRGKAPRLLLKVAAEPRP